MPAENRPAVVVSCEHGGHRVPAPYRSLFEGAEDVLSSHRGFDAGALEMATCLSKALEAPLLASTVTRLLVDLNRSESHPRVFSEWTRRLSREERERLIETWHRPHREAVRAAVAARMRTHRPVVHVASHSFVPVLDGAVRELDVGLLYDPARSLERTLAADWRRALRDREPTLRVRFNRPYRGTSDGLTRWLRPSFPDPRYAGIELEVNQALLEQPRDDFPGLRSLLAEALAQSLRRL